MDARIAVVGGQIKSRIAGVPALLKENTSKENFDAADFANLINTKLSSAAAEKQGFPERIQTEILSAAGQMTGVVTIQEMIKTMAVRPVFLPSRTK